MPNLGPLEIAIIAGIIVLLFGVGRISGLGRELGTSIREFRRGVKEEKEEEGEEAATTVQAQTQAPPPPPAAQTQAPPPPQQAAPPATPSPPTEPASGDGSGSRNVF